MVSPSYVSETVLKGLYQLQTHVVMKDKVPPKPGIRPGTPGPRPSNSIHLLSHRFNTLHWLISDGRIRFSHETCHRHVETITIYMGL